MKVKSVNLLVNDYCNNKCKSCFIWENTSRVDLPVTDITKLFTHDEFTEVEDVSVSGGEALMREDISEVIDAIVKGTPRLKMLFLNTNGMYPKRAERVVEQFAGKVPELYICVSIEGSEEVNNYLRGVKTFNLACETLERVSDLKKPNTRTIVSTTLQSENATVENLDYLLDLAGKTNSGFTFRFASVSTTYYQNLLNPPSSIDKAQKLSLVEHVAKKRPEDPFLRMQKDYIKTGKARVMQAEDGTILCLAGSLFCFVKADGSIYPCLYSTRSIGTAKSGIAKPIHKIGEYEPCPCFTECHVYPMINYGSKVQSEEKK